MKLTPIAKSSSELDQKILEITHLNSLYKTIPISIRETVQDLLWRVNSFYSNKIEGNPTKPREVLELDKLDQKLDEKGVDEIRRHLVVQFALQKIDYSSKDRTTQAFLKDLHRAFYAGTSVEDRTVTNKDGESFVIEGGSYRTTEVMVGSHFPPNVAELEEHMRFFSTTYKLEDSLGLEKFYKVAASHHRLAWIHPFLDGNGRVNRMFTDCYMKSIGLDSHGLWSVSRGFARDIDSYYKHLAIADSPRQGNYDGKGILSDRGLAEWTKYFFDVVIDQMTYILSLLRPESLRKRVEVYMDICIAGGSPYEDESKELPKLPKESKAIYLDLLYEGAKMRKELASSHGVGEKKLREILSLMEVRGLVRLEHKQPVQALLPLDSTYMLFPNLIAS
jgi:Fic family protein